MANNQGNFIKLYRSLLTWKWYGDIPTCRLWIHLLLTVRWKDGKDEHGRPVKRGCIETTLGKLAEETGLSIQQTRTALSHLKSTHELTCTSTNKKTLITLEKWDFFQGDDEPSNKHINTHINTHSNKQNHKNQQTYLLYKECIEEGQEERQEEGDVSLTDIADMWNSICTSYPAVKRISPDTVRGKLVASRLKEYGADQIREAFEKVERSEFLRGGNQNGWSATFDWVMKPGNFLKVLEGNYDHTRNNNTIKFRTDPQNGRDDETDWNELLLGRS